MLAYCTLMFGVVLGCLIGYCHGLDVGRRER